MFSATIHVPPNQPTIRAGIGMAENGDRNIDFGGKTVKAMRVIEPKINILATVKTFPK